MVRVLGQRRGEALDRVIASKRATMRDKDRAQLAALEATRLARR
jgi:hypothetical protein